MNIRLYLLNRLLQSMIRLKSKSFEIQIEHRHKINKEFPQDDDKLYILVFSDACAPFLLVPLWATAKIPNLSP